MGRNTAAMKRGWNYDKANSRLAVMVDGVEAANFSTEAVVVNKPMTITGATGITGAVTVTGNVGVTGLVTSTGLNYQKATATATAGAATLTLTAAQVLTGLIVSTPTEAQAMTLPTAADLIAAMPLASIGTQFDLVILNTAAGSSTITVTTNTGNTLHGAADTIAQNKAAVYRVLVTAAAAVAYIRIGDAA